MHFGNVAGPEADACEPLALGRKHRTDSIRVGALAVRCHQFQRRVVEREKDAIGAIAAVLPGRRACKQGLVSGGGRVDIAGENDDMVQAGDHGNRPRVFLAARTFSTPIAIAAVRCGILSALARCTMVSKARSRMAYSRRVTSSSSQNNCCRSCTHSK